MKPDRPTSISIALQGLLLALAILYPAIYLILAYLRLPYPFDLEWMEGACVDHVRRILAGHKLYVGPSLDFVPFIYPPLYFYLSALVSRLLGVGFLPLRLVSFSASLGCFLIIFLLVRRQTRSSFAGLLAVGLFAACYRVSGAWFDIARVDTLYLLLLLAAFHLLQINRSWASYLAAAALLTLSFLTKQIALPMALPLLAFSLFYRWRRGLLLTGAVVLMSALSTWALDRLHGGWYSYYVFELPRQHAIIKTAILDFWTKDLLSVLPVALPGALFFLGLQLKQPNKRDFFFWAAVAVGMVGGAWASRAHEAGYDNVLIPAYAVIAALFAMGAYALLRHAQSRPNARRRLIEIAVYLLCITQFCRLYYDPFAQLPTVADRAAGARLLGMMRQIDGDVIMPYRGYLPSRVGKRTYPHAMAVWDVARGTAEAPKERLLGEMLRAIREQRFSAIIVDAEVWGQPDVTRYYAPHLIWFPDDVFWPVTGMRSRPKYLYLPRREAPPS